MFYLMMHSKKIHMIIWHQNSSSRGWKYNAVVEQPNHNIILIYRPSCQVEFSVKEVHYMVEVDLPVWGGGFIERGLQHR